MARAFDLPVIAWGPLAEGRRTGKYLRGETGRLSLEGTFAPGEHDDEVVRAVVEVARSGGWTPAQVALAWLRTRPGTVVPLIGATRESRLGENLASAGVVLDRPALDRLDEAGRPALGSPTTCCAPNASREARTATAGARSTTAARPYAAP